MIRAHVCMCMCVFVRKSRSQASLEHSKLSPAPLSVRKGSETPLAGFRMKVAGIAGGLKLEDAVQRNCLRKIFLQHFTLHHTTLLPDTLCMDMLGSTLMYIYICNIYVYIYMCIYIYIYINGMYVYSFIDIYMYIYMYGCLPLVPVSIQKRICPQPGGENYGHF